MLAHAASAQGISAVENICDRPYILNHNSVPAACFTHPEVRSCHCPKHEPVLGFSHGQMGANRGQLPVEKGVIELPVSSESRS